MTETGMKILNNLEAGRPWNDQVKGTASNGGWCVCARKMAEKGILKKLSKDEFELSGYTINMLKRLKAEFSDIDYNEVFGQCRT